MLRLMQMENEFKLLTVSEVANQLGISRQGVHYLAKTGKIRPIENIKGKFRFFSELEICRYFFNEKFNPQQNRIRSFLMRSFHLRNRKSFIPKKGGLQSDMVRG